MGYVPIPIAMLPVGQPLPVSLWTPDGRLLLRKGQAIVSEAHRDKLYAHNASATEAEGQAWQRAYERMVHTMMLQGVDIEEIARMPMPSTIHERDYHANDSLKGGWLDLQEVLRGILYQGGLAINPLPRLVALENRARKLLAEDADDSLFNLFQALGDASLGYCATHALLCAVGCELAAQKMGLDAHQRQTLMSAALTMNIGMAREQDTLARQLTPPSDEQRQLIQGHPSLSVEILRGYGVADEIELDLVRWHHQPESPQAMATTLHLRLLLSMADVFVAMMAARGTRRALSPLESAKAMYLKQETELAATVGSALAASFGFYPPGTYVRLTGGETAVSVQRGLRANTPWVIVVVDRDGIPSMNYQCLDTSHPAHAIAAPIAFSGRKVVINAERVRRARERIRR